jgi:hypothetical protein
MTYPEEVWVEIPEFPEYLVSSYGQIARKGASRVMSIHYTNHGHAKINFSCYGQRRTRSVALLVAQAFVVPPNENCTAVVQLDGDQTNLFAWNLVWRPEGMAWKYHHQFKVHPPLHYMNLPIMNTMTNVVYKNVVEAAVAEGLLFEDIWRAAHTGEVLHLTNSRFQVVH